MVANYLTSTAFMLIVLLILFIKICKDMKQEKIKQMYQILDAVVALYVLLDAGFAVSLLLGLKQLLVLRVIVFLFFLIYVITPFVWQLFVRSYVEVPHSRLFWILEKIPLIVLLVMVLFSLPTGYVWEISQSGEYMRGNGFRLFTAINLFYYLEAFGNGICILYKKMYRKDHYLLQSLILSTLPLTAILVNTYLIPLQMTYPFQPFCLVLGTLFAYLFMADRQKNLLEEHHQASLNQALELEKEASRKAIEAGAVKSIFLANMSHDIRTPINAILGFADIIERHPDEEERVRDSVMKIKSSGHVLLNLINDVLDLSRIENDKLQLNEAPTDLNEMTEGFKELFHPAMMQGKLNFDIRRNLSHPYVLCDEGKLQRILVNIINNAVKFTPKDGQITLSVSEHLHFSESSTEAPTEYLTESLTEYPTGEDNGDGWGNYEFLVQDTGIGISKEFQSHIFEAFEQEQNPTISNPSGAGLGLSIVKKLVDLMKGNIEIASTPGNGTAIKISFSFLKLKSQEAPNNEEAENSPVSEDLSGIKILLAEDNELNREIALAILEENGAEVTWTANGKEALDCFERSEVGFFDIILMDVMMPVMDGLESTRRIRALKRPDSQSIPIFAMTANAFQEDIQKSKEAGVTAHFSKPLDYELLIRKTKEFVGV